MNAVFYVSSVVAIVSTVLVVTRPNAVHALLYLIVSLLAVALIFFVLGAPFAAALEVIIYAGAIMVLFVFVMMMLNLGRQTIEQEKKWLTPWAWVGPVLLAVILLGELVYVLAGPAPLTTGVEVTSKQVGMCLLGPYLLGVELASFLLLAGLVGAYHLGRSYGAGPETGGES
jgi:NADH-quinone oxidoreductase subunit J